MSLVRLSRRGLKELADGHHRWYTTAVLYPPPPGSGLSDWTQIGPTTAYLALQDSVDGNGNIIDPDADITDSSRQVFGRGAQPASFVGFRMRYDTKAGDNPVIKVFGRTRYADNTAGHWQILKNRLKDASVAILIDPSDIVVDDPNSLFATTADQESHYFEIQGCNEFLVGVETRADAQSDAVLEAKFV